MRSAVDCREMAPRDVREEITEGNDFGGKSGSHGGGVILLSHMQGDGAITVVSPHVPADQQRKNPESKALQVLDTEQQRSTQPASLVAQTVKCLPVVLEARVQFLGWEGSLKKGVTSPSSMLAWSIPWTEEPRDLQSMGLQSQT